jgi:hypothetical protein
MIGVKNVGGDSLRITNIVVVDSLGTQIKPRHNRKDLVKGTKETKRRYKGEGFKVKAGVSGAVLLGAGVVAAAGTSGSYWYQCLRLVGSFAESITAR